MIIETMIVKTVQAELLDYIIFKGLFMESRNIENNKQRLLQLLDK